MIIKRDRYLQKLIERRHSSYIKIITGIRRCGKSYLLKKLYYDYLLSEGVNKEQIIMVELDDDRFENQREKKQLREYIESKASDSDRQYYIFIDEVQIVKDFEGTVISINNHDNYDVYITGSNSEFLSKDISTRFKDRGSEIRVHPLSFEEYYNAYQGDKRYALTDYLTYGGMPRLFDEKTEADKISYLNNLINRTYLSDVVERNNLRLPEEMSSLFDLLCSSTGSLVSPNSIAGTLQADKHIKIDGETIFSYIQYLEDAFIFEKARSYNELRNRGYTVDVGLLETRERNTEGKQVYKQNEVDFVARFASKEYYIQVMNEAPEGQHKENEYSNLIKVPGSFKKIAIINTPFKSYTDENGILIISLEEFLVNQSSLDL